MEIIYKLGDFPDPGDRDLYNGIQETNKNNYKKALEYFEKSSRYDNEYGSLFAAVLHYAGFGLTERNPSRALELFKVIASTWNNRVAQYLIGMMYFKGDRGVTMDKEAGTRWFLLAANNGWSDAMIVTADFYLQVGDKLKTVVAWLKKVAKNDDSDVELIDNGTLYLFGNKDFELSMTHVKPEIMSILSLKGYRLISPVSYVERECDSRMPNSKELRQLRFWDLLTNKKSSGVSTAQMFLSRIYNSDDRLLKDVNKALYWAKKSAKNENEESYIFLGLFYSVGKDIAPDYKEAIKWFEKAYNTGRVPPASLHLGLLYKGGIGVERNYTTALRLFKKYISYNVDENGLAYCLMGQIYLDGDDGVSQNYIKAFKCLLKAYELGYCNGATELGGMYFRGLGVEKNDGKAIQWFAKAAAMGSSQAKLILNELINP
ncbi:hypothetical protein EDC94DRAFT_606616 [Helicostylum pulchrum]|nr:hypothetical protein EDC94DRAFT_606616 [Helicostylum pulchrum]